MSNTYTKEENQFFGEVLKKMNRLENENQEFEYFIEEVFYDSEFKAYCADLPFSDKIAWGDDIQKCFENFKDIYRGEKE